MSSNEIMDIEKRLTELKTCMNAANKRIDELQRVTKAFYDLASDVKVMVNEMTNMKQDINTIKKDINEYHNEPQRLMFNAKNAIIIAVLSVIVSAIITLIIK